jgi:hypothetical protein
MYGLQQSLRFSASPSLNGDVGITLTLLATLLACNSWASSKEHGYSSICLHEKLSTEYSKYTSSWNYMDEIVNLKYSRGNVAKAEN